MFTKLFDTEKYGQVVLMKNTNRNGDPALICYAEPEGFNACEVVLSFEDSDEGYAKRDKAFDEADEGLAIKLANQIFHFTEGSGNE